MTAQPYGELRPDHRADQPSAWTIFVAAISWTGISIFVCESVRRDSGIVITDPAPLLFWHLGPAALVGFLRSCHWLGGTRPPISLVGRVRTGRLICWDYDRVLIVPLLGLIVGLMLFKMSQPTGWPWTIPISGLIAILLNGLAPPRRMDFRLTSSHHFAPPLTRGKDWTSPGQPSACTELR